MKANLKSLRIRKKKDQGSDLIYYFTINFYIFFGFFIVF